MNGNNTMRNWIVLLNIIINSMRKITQDYLDWGAALALFKEIQALGWLNFITCANLLRLVSPKIKQPNKCRMARTTSAQSVQAQSSTRKNTLPCQEPLYFISVFVQLLGLGLTESKCTKTKCTRLKCHITGPYALLVGMLKDMKKREKCGVSLGN